MISEVLRSCWIAARGVLLAARSQRNFQIHLLAAAAALLVGALLQLTRMEFILLTVTIALVISAELLNTALEFLLNLMEARDHPVVRATKDVAAGAVLMAVAGSVAVGILLFGPRLCALFRGR
ncbi:MAG: diacylglycerol kinase family protein [Candidatus Omnitrophica bacterium]|nr:diacylglycerol kinase family protein [Candidatus Omnitrophota bacterium]